MGIPPTSSIRRPEIDGLRAMAAVWVMCDHFGISRLVGMHYGFLAVRVMLILSAYFAARQLRLLWDSGPQAGHEAIASKLVHYYSSRVIRLGLLAYGTILLAVALDVDGARGTWRWHAAFATNAYIAKHGDWPGSLSHFWSLAVQMQFLLVLPLVILMVSKRALWPVLVAGMLAALGHRACVVLGEAGDFQRWMPITNSLDAFCLGVGLAWVERERPPVFARLTSPWVCGSALACLAGVHWLRGHAYDLPIGVFTETGESIALVLLFGALLGGRTFGPLGWLLRRKPLVKLGAASLSLYALHPIVERVLSRAAQHPKLEHALSSAPVFQLLAVLASLAVAWIAYLLLEIPARKISAGLEPVLTRWAIALSKGRRRRVAAAWRLQPAGALLVCLGLFYAAVSPLRIGSPILREGVEIPEVAIDALEEAPDTPASFFPEQPEPPIIDDTLNIDVA